MKKSVKKHALYFIASLLLGAFACSWNPARAQDFIGATYDLTAEGTNQAALCVNLWGSAPQTYTLDGSMDANTNAASGAEKVVVTMNGQGNDQFVSKFGFAETNSALFTNVEFDVFWDTSSPQNCWYGPYCPFYGHLDFGFTTPTSTDIYDSLNIAIADAGHWLHVVRPIQTGEQVNGILLKMYCGGYGNPENGTITFWVDNIKLTGRRPVTTLQPTMGIQKVTPALRIFAGSYINTSDREELATVDQSQSWIGGASVSYSFTLLSYPHDVNINQTHIFLIPANSATPGNTMYNNQYIDYQASNGMWLVLTPFGSGVTASVKWKTNLPNANPNQTALTITNSTAVGTWTLTFNSASTGTLTAPGASPAGFTIADPNVATHFANPLVAYFGLQPNSTAGYGEYEDWASISVTGVAGVNENDNFTTDSSLNSGVWTTSCSAAPSSVVLVTSATPYWVSWTLPDSGFVDGSGLGYLAVATNLIAGPWVVPEYYNNYNDGLNLPGTTRQGNMKWTLIPSTCLPTVDGQPQSGQKLSPNAFFRLYNTEPPNP
jgi:hypothetical protein